jgi:hypothetical protein
MKTLLNGRLLVVCLARVHAGEPLTHVDDPGLLLSSESKWMQTAEAKLADYERASGIRIIVQFHLKSPTEAEDAKPGAYMHALARKLRIDRGGVLMVYFHDDPDWRVWIGDELTNRFTGKAGTVAELTTSEAIHNVKEAMLTAAHAKAEAEIDRIQKSVPDGKPLTAAQRLTVQTDVLFEALKAKFTVK